MGARKGVDGDAIMAIAHGVRTMEVIRRVAPHLDAEAEAMVIENHEAHDQAGSAVMPGAADLLKSIPEGRWGVVTSGSRLLATCASAFLRVAVPKVLVTADDVTNGKPHPEPYLKGAERLGFEPADCLVIEDAPAGIQSARAGGMKVIGITSTYAAAKLGEADVQKFGQVQVARTASVKLDRIEGGEIGRCGHALTDETKMFVRSTEFQYRSQSSSSIPRSVFSSRYFTITGV